MPFIIRKTISQTFLDRVHLTPDHVGFLVPTSLGQWRPMTYRQIYEECRQISFGLMSLGISPGDRVVILSNTRYEWSLCDMAILGASAVTVPIYASNTAEDVAYIIRHCEARVAIVEDIKQLQKILTQRQRDPGCLPQLEKVIVMDPALSAVELGEREVTQNAFVSLEALIELGRREETKNPTRFEQNLSNAKTDDLFTICYTSGTTGIPKGAMLTHDNMMSVLEDAVALYAKHIVPEGETILSFLPFSHILGRVESMSIYVFGFTQGFAENIDRLMINIADVKPTVIFAVPRIFEKAFSRIQTMLSETTGIKGKISSWGLEAGREYYERIWGGNAPSARATAKYHLAKQLVFTKIHQRFGGRLKFALCGGAPLPKEIGEFFQLIGIKVLEGYGLTETCAPVTLNTLDELRFGSVGRPMPEVTMKIAEDGEILIKSRKVFKGYYKMPKETAEALSKGWFHTGDIGFIDAQGFVHITDRKKDLIVTSTGKNIAPQKIENLAKTYKLISQFVIHGDRRSYLTALITLEREQIIKFASENQILFSEYSELIKNPKIIGLVQSMVDQMNQRLASFETIKKFLILPNDFSIETGELTPSLKVRRKQIEKLYGSELDQLYRSTHP